MLAALLGSNVPEPTGKPGKPGGKPTGKPGKPEKKSKPKSKQPAKPSKPAKPKPKEPAPYEPDEYAEFVPLPFETNVPMPAPVDGVATMARELSKMSQDSDPEDPSEAFAKAFGDRDYYASEDSLGGESSPADAEEDYSEGDVYVDDHEWTSPSCVRAAKKKKKARSFSEPPLDYSDVSDLSDE